MGITEADQTTEAFSEHLRFVGHYFFVIARFAVEAVEDLGKLARGVEYFQRVAMSLDDKGVWEDGEKFVEAVRVVG
jgi:hypothetical protein